MAQQQNPKDWIAVGRLSWRGINTLGDLGRIAEVSGTEAVMELLREACSSAA
jgi:hypothetical protein